MIDWGLLVAPMINLRWQSIIQHLPEECGEIGPCPTRHGLISDYHIKPIWMILENSQGLKAACSDRNFGTQLFEHRLSPLIQYVLVVSQQDMLVTAGYCLLGDHFRSDLQRNGGEKDLEYRANSEFTLDIDAPAIF